MLPLVTFKKIISQYKLLTPAQMRGLVTKATKLNKNLEELVVSEGMLNEVDFYTKVGEFLDVPYISLRAREIKKEVLNLIPGPVAGAHQVVAFEKDKDEIKLAMTDPTDMQTIEFLRRKTGLEPRVYVVCPNELKEALRKYHAQLEDDLKIIQENIGDSNGDDLKKAAEELPTVNIVNSVLEHAVYEGASDIHIEPCEKELTVRYRVDGVLKQVMTLPKNIQNGIVARIKILANLKIDEHMLPQDGRFKIQVQDEKLAFRVSIIPVYDGEKIVLRLLHEGSKPLSLEQLGLLAGPQKILINAIKKPHGMILVTGPTGSGKTTTLYSVLGILNKPGVNISTIEDPIEYRVSGVNQCQINPKVGFTFAAGLRAFLRQDPNIIMVGEIRDQETAEIAIHAAMTGHLVLSTLHTNDAPTTIPRLIDMGVPPFLVAFTCNIVMAQRLVRKICPYCKEEFIVDKTVSNELGKAFDVKKLPQLFKDNIFENKEDVDTGKIIFYQGKGCGRCGSTGYKGRVGIYEILEVDEELTKKINSRANADEIKNYARERGMLTMLEDGLIKAKMGVTSLSEVLRVTKE